MLSHMNDYFWFKNSMLILLLMAYAQLCNGAFRMYAQCGRLMLPFLRRFGIHSRYIRYMMLCFCATLCLHIISILLAQKFTDFEFSLPEFSDLSDKYVDLVIEKCRSNPRPFSKDNISCLYVRNALLESVTGIIYYYRPHNKHLPEPSGNSQWVYPRGGVSAYHLAQLTLHAVDSKAEWHRLLIHASHVEPTGPPRTLNRCRRKKGVECTTSLRPLAVVDVLYEHALVSAAWVNMWHTMAEYFVILYHTLSPLLLRRPRAYSAEAAMLQNLVPNGTGPLPYYAGMNLLAYLRQDRLRGFKGCRSMWECIQSASFDPFRRLFGGGVFFSEKPPPGRSGAQSVRQVLRLPNEWFEAPTGKAQPATSYNWLYANTLLLGINTACSSLGENDNNSTDCHMNLWNVRHTVLTLYNLPPNRTVWDVMDKNISRDMKCLEKMGGSSKSGSNKRVVLSNDSSSMLSNSVELPMQLGRNLCPTVYALQRRSRIRRMWRLEEALQGATKLWANPPLCCNSGNQLITSGDVSTDSSFEMQLQDMNKRIIFLAARGAGAALYIFLPLGASYIAVSDSFLWQPFKGLYPTWITVIHVKSTSVIPENPHIKASRNTDGNKSAYRLNPRAIAAILYEQAMMIVAKSKNNT